MSDYVPTTDRVRADYAETYEGTDERRYARFDRWLAEVERAAAEKAWVEGAHAVTVEIRQDPKTPNAIMRGMQARTRIPANPYRAEAYRQERGER